MLVLLIVLKNNTVITQHIFHFIRIMRICRVSGYSTCFKQSAKFLIQTSLKLEAMLLACIGDVRLLRYHKMMKSSIPLPLVRICWILVALPFLQTFKTLHQLQTQPLEKKANRLIL